MLRTMTVAPVVVRPAPTVAAPRPAPVLNVAATTVAAPRPVSVTPIPAPRPVAPPVAMAPMPPAAVAPAVNPPPNPYPQGISVAGTGPNGSSTTWRTGWHTTLEVYVADTGFGIAPIYTDADFPGLVHAAPGGIALLKGYPNENFTSQSAAGAVDLGQGIDINGNPLVGMVELYTDAGNMLTIMTKDGGSQTIWYTFDGTYYVPAHAQGKAKPSVPLVDSLVMWTAIAATVVITAGGPAGILGPATPGPGAAALAGSPSDLAAGSYAVAASPSFTAPAAAISPPSGETFSGPTTVSTPPQQIAPEIANFTPPPIAAPTIVPPELAPLSVTAPAVGAGAAGAGIASTGGEILTGIKTAGTIAGAVGTVAGTVAKLTSGSAPGAALPPARPIQPVIVPTSSGHGLFSALPPAQIGSGSSQWMWPLLILATFLVIAHGSD